MYQSAGSEVIDYIAKAIGKPLVKKVITGKPKLLELKYKKTENDEVENMFDLL